MSYIRRKRVPAKVKGGRKSYFYYYRCRSVRTPEGKSREIVLAYLGTAEQAIDRLEAEQMDEVERAALRQRLEGMIGEELAA